MIVANAPQQGGDYGWDYQCTDFDAKGEIAREFKAQVKHLADMQPVGNNRCTYLGQYHIVSGRPPFLAKYAIKSSQIKTWTDPQKSPGPMLFVLADKERVIFAWVQDIYDFYLRWLALGEQKSHTVHLTDIRQMLNFGNLPSLLMDREPRNDRWIDVQVAQHNLDAVFHMGLSLYLRCLHCGTQFLKKFDSEGFTKKLLSESKANPHLMLAFAAFLGQLSTPCDYVLRWAKKVVSSWDNPWFIPAAIQLLSCSTDEAGMAMVMSRFRSAPPGGEGTVQILGLVKSPWREHADWRFGAEFNIAAGTFIERRIQRFRDKDAQEILIQSYYAWNPSIRYPNFATTAIEHLATRDMLIKDHESYQTLIRYASVSKKRIRHL